MKRRAGRPKFKPSAEQREQVRLMAACGIPEDEMVILFINPQTSKPITAKTLRANFREELDRGLLQSNLKVVGSLFKNATTPTKIYPHGNPILQIFWAKCRLRWNQDRGRMGLGESEVVAPVHPMLDDGAAVVLNNDLARRVAFMLTEAADAGTKVAKAASTKKRQPA